MRRLQFIATIDVLAFICFILLVSTGILMEYLLPPGSGRGMMIWGMDRHAWGDIHFWVAVVFFSILVIHLFLHWQFIVRLIKGRAPERWNLRTALGVVALLALIAIAVAPLLSPIEENPGRGRRDSHAMHER